MRVTGRQFLVVLIAACGLGRAVPTAAQLDPILFLKSPPPNVIVGLDLSSAMLRDEQGRYYDPALYNIRGETFESVLGLTAGRGNTAYRRIYTGLRWLDSLDKPRAVTSRIDVVADLDAGYATFDSRTRLGRARASLARAIRRNALSVRFGLVTSRQDTPLVPTPDAVLQVEEPGQTDTTDAGGAGTWKAALARVAAPGSATTAKSRTVAADTADSNRQLLALLARTPREAGALVAAGEDLSVSEDRPLDKLLDDLRAEAGRLVSGDTSCRNTLAVLVVAGGMPDLVTDALASRADLFLHVGSRRVPLYVIALAPDAGSVDQLRTIASRGGGRYIEIAADRLSAPADGAVAELIEALNLVVQHAFTDAADLLAAPVPLADGTAISTFTTGQPVVGTVNLENALDASGAPLPNTRLTAPDGSPIPQRSNLVVTGGFALPGFIGTLSARRVYRPIADSTRAIGYRFEADGALVWTARVPAPDRRNLFTILPGRGLVRFSDANLGLLAPYLQAADPERLIEWVRSHPLGPITNGTPALLTPPALALPNLEYLAFADQLRLRRSLLFVGAGDGMLHAFDARTGVEVWAVVPFNLLPTLEKRREGHALDDMVWGVDASPRLADVRLSTGWRTVLVVGEGPGGTFYQAFDVTLDAADVLSATNDNRDVLLDWFSDPSRIRFLWSFPRYERFDPTWPPMGDLAASATEDEKSVGFTWATPWVAAPDVTYRHPVVLTGSGSLSASRQSEPNRGGVVAGTRFYMLDVETGVVLDRRDVHSDGVGEGATCAGPGCDGLKNALQSDPVAFSEEGPAVVERVYVGDLDGRLWRIALEPVAGGGPRFQGMPTLLFGGGADAPIFGSVAIVGSSAGSVTLALGTGSALLPENQAGRLVAITDTGTAASVRFDIPAGTDANGAPRLLSGSPASAGGVFFFTALARPVGSRCEAPAVTLFALTTTGGSAYGGHSANAPPGKSPPPTFRFSGRAASAAVVADRHLFVPAGTQLHLLGDDRAFNSGAASLGLRVLSLREVR